MLKVFMGIGILATPASFQLVGIVGGFVGMTIIGSLNMYTMKLQIAAKLKVQNEKEIISYSDLGNAVLGNKGKQFVDFCLIVS